MLDGRKFGGGGTRVPPLLYESLRASGESMVKILLSPFLLMSVGVGREDNGASDRANRSRWDHLLPASTGRFQPRRGTAL